MRAEEPMPVELFSVSHRAGGERRTITSRRLRATLRLLFDGRTADEVAGPAGDAPLDTEALSAVASRARSQYLLERVLRRLPGRNPNDDDRPLPASAGVPGGAAVALAFRTGLGLDISTIAEVLERAPEQVGADLFQARRAIDLSLPVPCERFTATVSMLNDRALDTDERLQYVSHLQNCDRCPAVVEAMAALDAELRAEVDRHEQPLPETPARRRRSGRLLLPVAAVAMVMLAGVAGVLMLSDVFGGSREPAPLLLTAETPPPYTGWLIQQTTEGRIEAVNLATRETQPLDAWGMDNVTAAMPVLSPGLERVALWHTNVNEFVLQLADVGGSELERLSFERASVAWMYFVGWLNDDEVLIVENPLGPPGETPDEFFERLAHESMLLAIDVTSGEQRVVYQGNVASAVVSPDQTRVVIILPRDQRWPGASFELREMGAGNIVGELITTVEHRMDSNNGSGVWSPDSRLFLFTRIADELVEPTEFQPGQVQTQSMRYEQAELASLSRDGELESIWAAEPDEPLGVSTVSSDGQTVIVQAGYAQTLGLFRGRFWRVAVDSGQAELLLESPHPSGVWSPDGSTLLWPTVVSSYLVGEPGDNIGRGVPDIAMMAYGADWSPMVVHGELGPGPIGPRPIGWLPEAALTPQVEQVVLLNGDVAEPAPVVNAGSGNVLVAGSAASPNGQYVTLRTADGGLMIWNTERRQGRQLQDGSTGGSWIAGGSGVLDTVQPQGSATANRLIFYAPQFDRANDARYDFRHFDPAGLGDGGSAFYAAPSMAPDQSRASFFVVDPAQRAVVLWVAGWDTTPQQALRWQIPGNRLLDVPLVAIWADERTLLVAQPDDWRDGLPRKSVLTRIVIDGNDVQVDALVELNVRPRDRGVLVWEMELSPDGSQLAYRLRQYSELSVEGGRTDVLHVVAVEDIGGPLELARGAPGDGMAWSQDSRWLVAGTRGRIALMSVDGRDFDYISPTGARAEYPLWITTHEIWFTLDSGNGSEIWRVRVD